MLFHKNVIDERSKTVIDLYLAEMVKNKSPKQEFAWGWQEETNHMLQQKILTYVRGKSLQFKVTNLGWGFSVEMKHG